VERQALRKAGHQLPYRARAVGGGVKIKKQRAAAELLLSIKDR